MDEHYLDLQELVLNIDDGLLSMENAVNQNMEFLQNLANTENVADEIQAQILLEETSNSEFLETIKLPEEIMDNKNMAIHSESENMTNDFESIVKVYPNPASNYLFIETHENSQAVGELTIVNQSGQIVYQNHTTKNALSSGICVSNFTPGNYLIQLKTENKTFFGKFVKY